ncbi:transposase [Candidatus Enterovibrio escicola]|uniref:transposase n=1 Tax=Candidatus Enterovibrio escicola TaxID=1927127 RepID=UPI001237E917
MGNVNAEVFHAWIEQDLLPKIPEQAVIVMDNASFHKRIDTLEAIEARGRILE